MQTTSNNSLKKPELTDNSDLTIFVGQNMDSIDNLIGKISNLTTNTKTDLVSAINEVKSNTNVGMQTQINNNTIDILKTNFKVSALQNASKYGMKNMVIDDYNDIAGINNSLSVGYGWDSTNKQIKMASGQQNYQTTSDFNKLTFSQTVALNNLLQLGNTTPQPLQENFSAVANVGNASSGNGSSVAIDSNGTAHFVLDTNRVNASYYNIDYYTITSAGTVSAVIPITTGTAGSYGSSIAVDSNGTSHIVFYSTIYNVNFQNVGYVTVTSSGTVSAITWLTTSTTSVTNNPVIAVDSSGTSHIVFQSRIYNASYWNIAYVTVTSSSVVSAITWLTTSTTAHSQNSSIKIDSSGTSHIVIQSQIYNASYWNTAYVTVTSSSVVSAITWLTTSTTANSSYPSITIDSSGTSHIVFSSNIYNASYANIAYITVTSSGTVSGINWITISTTATSQVPSISVDANGIRHVVFHSYIYNATYWNVAYVTLSGIVTTSNYTQSAINWMTTSTTASNTYAIVAGGGTNPLYILWSGASAEQFVVAIPTGGLPNFSASTTFASGVDASTFASIAVDSNGTAHIVLSTARYNASYHNIDYYTITSSGVVSAVIPITTSTTANSYNPTIAVGSDGTSHIVFNSLIYNATYNNIAYATVTSSGTTSMGWLTVISTANSYVPTITIDTSNTCHIVFQSQIYNANDQNIAYITVLNSGSASAITWLTTNTTSGSYNPRIKIDSNGTKHIVFDSYIYTTSHTNIAYMTVTSSGTASSITWLTTSTTASSSTSSIVIDYSNTSHIVFSSNIYNATYNNIAYATVTSSGTASAITWLTTSTTASSQSPIITLDSNGTSYIVFQTVLYANTLNTVMVEISNSGTISPLYFLTENTSVAQNYSFIICNDGMLYLTTVSSSNIASFRYANLGAYYTSGTAVGTIDAGQTVTWNNISLTDTLPVNTSASIQYQTSSDNITWSTSATIASGATISGVISRYLKFIITLSTTNINATPTVSLLQVNWTNPQATIVSTVDTASTEPTQIILDAEYSAGTTGTIIFAISIDSGNTYMNITPDTLTTISGITSGTSVVSKIVLTQDATITSLGCSWQ